MEGKDRKIMSLQVAGQDVKTLSPKAEGKCKSHHPFTRPKAKAPYSGLNNFSDVIPKHRQKDKNETKKTSPKNPTTTTTKFHKTDFIKIK